MEKYSSSGRLQSPYNTPARCVLSMCIVFVLDEYTIRKKITTATVQYKPVFIFSGQIYFKTVERKIRSGPRERQIAF